MTQYDNTQTIAKYIDRHVLVNVLEFVDKSNIYEGKDVALGRLKLLEKTRLCQLLIESYNGLDLPVPEEVLNRESFYTEEYEKHNNINQPLLSLLSNEELIEEMKKTKDGECFGSQLLAEYPLLGEDCFTDFHSYMLFMYDIGSYPFVSNCLFFMKKILNKDDRLYYSTIWGLLTSSIMHEDYITAKSELESIIDNISHYNQKKLHSESLLQELWIIHTSLFIYFNFDNGMELFIQKVFDKFKMSIQNNCPHILRYCGVAAVTTTDRQTLKEINKILKDEDVYFDPITQFIVALYHDFDFELARQKLIECESVFKVDYFLKDPKFYQNFLEGARQIMFEIFSRTHKCISLEMLGGWLNFNVNEAERWVVGMLKRDKVKIDSEKGLIIMGSKENPVYNKIISRTKLLAFKTQVMYMELESRVNKI